MLTQCWLIGTCADNWRLAAVGTRPAENAGSLDKRLVCIVHLCLLLALSFSRLMTIIIIILIIVVVVVAVVFIIQL